MGFLIFANSNGDYIFTIFKTSTDEKITDACFSSIKYKHRFC